MTIPRDYSGQRFGRWVMVSYVGRGRWLCRCDCGTEHVHRANTITGGWSHGCIKCRPKPNYHFKHGQKHTPLYAVRCAIINRCENPKDRSFKNYGGRGIKLCPEWRQSFEAFRDWALKSGYAHGLTIDRHNNDGNYEPANCRWVTKRIQSWNRRNNKRVIYKGKLIPLAKLAKQHGLLASVVRKRVFQSGWEIERAINTPVQARAKP